MSEQRLREMLEASASGIATGPAPLIGIEQLARQRRQRRRTWPAVAGTIALVVAGSVAVYRFTSSETGPRPDVDPLTAEALRNYDPLAMAERMDATARAVFSRTVDDLPAGQFKASGELSQRLPSTRYREAHSMEVLFPMPDRRELWLWLGHGGSYAEGDPERICAASLESGGSVSCEVERVGDDVATVTVEATAAGWMGPELGLRPNHRDDINDRSLVLQQDLDAIDPEALYFERRVKVVHSETFVSVASETVHAATPDEALQAFQVPVSDLFDLATEPTMVIPEPAKPGQPEGESELVAADNEPCPTAMPTSPRDDAATTAAVSDARFMRPDQAWVCRYIATSSGGPSTDQSGPGTWTLDGSVVELNKTQLRTIAPQLKGLTPITPNRCTLDLGPRWVLVLATEGDLTGIAIDDFGCNITSLTENPHTIEPGTLTQHGVVGGAFTLPPTFLEQLRQLGGGSL